MQDAANTYQPLTSANGMAIVLPHDQLCRLDRAGRPDYSDPEIFPEIWPGKARNVKHA